MGWQVELEGRIKPFAEKADYVRPVIHVDESAKADYFDVGYDYEVGTGSISERDIQRALMKGDSFIERDGHTILLDADAIQQAQEVFEDCATEVVAAEVERDNTCFLAVGEPRCLYVLDIVQIEPGECNHP